jgi:hypothetical protein
MTLFPEPCKRMHVELSAGNVDAANTIVQGVSILTCLEGGSRLVGSGYGFWIKLWSLLRHQSYSTGFVNVELVSLAAPPRSRPHPSRCIQFVPKAFASNSNLATDSYQSLGLKWIFPAIAFPRVQCQVISSRLCRCKKSDSNFSDVSCSGSAFHFPRVDGPKEWEHLFRVCKCAFESCPGKIR